MTKIFIFGIGGKMGKMLIECVKGKPFAVAGGFDLFPHPDYPTFSDVQAVNVDFDVIIDFTRPETLDSVIALAEKYRRPAVLCTTGYDENARAKIDALAQKTAVFQSGNMSYGINVLSKLAEYAARLLKDNSDIEIIEKHHNQKADAPSGTAKMLERAVEKGTGRPLNFLYGREGNDCLRKKDDVGVHAVRGGTIVGDHEVSFCCNDEVITVSHTAYSRKVFAEGALKAAAFLCGKPAGKFDMNDLNDK